MLFTKNIYYSTFIILTPHNPWKNNNSFSTLWQLFKPILSETCSKHRFMSHSLCVHTAIYYHAADKQRPSAAPVSVPSAPSTPSFYSLCPAFVCTTLYPVNMDITVLPRSRCIVHCEYVRNVAKLWKSQIGPAFEVELNVFINFRKATRLSIWYLKGGVLFGILS